jgi:hypothetical protein
MLNPWKRSCRPLPRTKLREHSWRKGGGRQLMQQPLVGEDGTDAARDVDTVSSAVSAVDHWHER